MLLYFLTQVLGKLLHALFADWLPGPIKADELLIVNLDLFASLGTSAVPNHVPISHLAPHPLLDTAVFLLHDAFELIGRNPGKEEDLMYRK